MERLTVSCVASLYVVAAFAAPSVSGVSYSQNSTSKVMKVTYALSGDEGVPLLDIRTNGVSIGWSNLRGAYGDVHKIVQPGSEKTIYWHPDKAWPGRSLASGVTAVVRVYPRNNPPDVMVVNCEKPYKGRGDVVQYFASFEQLPEGTVNCDTYKTTKMAFRKVPSAGIVWRMGSPASEKGRDANYEIQHKVRLTSNYYLGVFEVTQTQYERFMKTNPSMFKIDGAMRPVEMVSWENVRGKTSIWPGETRAAAYGSVTASSFLGLLRSHTGGNLKFDLPTEAQWEFACRAGSGAAFPDGTSLAAGSEASWPFLETHGRYKNNSGADSSDVANTLSTNDATSVVGTYLPNRWGFHDMHGNLYEWTLDLYAAYDTSKDITDDPCGSTDVEGAGGTRTTRGGSYLLPPSSARCAKRYQSGHPGNGSRHFGFRVCLPLE